MITKEERIKNLALLLPGLNYIQREEMASTYSPDRSIQESYRIAQARSDWKDEILRGTLYPTVSFSQYNWIQRVKKIPNTTVDYSFKVFKTKARPTIL